MGFPGWRMNRTSLRFSGRDLLMFAHRGEGGLRESHLEKGEQEREGGLGPLVLVDPLRVQPVAAATVRGIVQRRLQIVAAEEPLEAALRLAAPFPLPREAMRLETGGERGLRFQRL